MTRLVGYTALKGPIVDSSSRALLTMLAEAMYLRTSLVFFFHHKNESYCCKRAVSCCMGKKCFQHQRNILVVRDTCACVTNLRFMFHLRQSYDCKPTRFTTHPCSLIGEQPRFMANVEASSSSLPQPLLHEKLPRCNVILTG